MRLLYNCNGIRIIFIEKLKLNLHYLYKEKIYNVGTFFLLFIH